MSIFFKHPNKMSLRYLINLRILFSALCILLIGGSYAIWQARITINEEVDSSINLALQLIKLGFSQSAQSTYTENEWLPRLNSLEQTRHLNIQLKKPSGQIIQITGNNQQAAQATIPPQWFINSVNSKHQQVEYQITTFDGKPLTLIIQANPLDEITEVWRESFYYYLSIILLTLITFLAVNLVFNKSLKSITVIVDALKLIETGQYQYKLPEFSTREYDSIAKTINHMTFVLAKTQRENRALTRHSLEIQEVERQRLAQELHDELGQSLTAIKVLAVTAAHEKAEIKKISVSISDICNHLISVVRSMMHHLHPLILTELGLKATLEDMVSHWSERNPGLILKLKCTDAVDKLEQKITIQIFRVIQESLTNISRHAHAKQATITLTIIDETRKILHLEVKDNGRGCEMNDICSGFGLLGMQERINTLGGTFTAVSQPQQGMIISAHIPLP